MHVQLRETDDTIAFYDCTVAKVVEQWLRHCKKECDYLLRA